MKIAITLATMTSTNAFYITPTPTSIVRISNRGNGALAPLSMSENIVDGDTTPQKTGVGGKRTKTPVDLSGFSEGQKLEGKLLSVKAFGAFVEVPGGANVLLPRSVISRGSYSKLTRMVEAKSTDVINVEIVEVNHEKQTLSGKYIPAGVEKMLNIDDLQAGGPDVYKSKELQATVVGVHDFGVFAELDEYGTEGLIPVSRLPEGEVPQAYAVGSTVTVSIEEMNQEKKKMTLSMKSSGTGGAVGSSGGVGDSLSGVPSGKWLQGVVTSVSNFGLFVRPAGQDTIGLVHVSRIPAGLMKVLKGAANPAPDGAKTDVELLFQPGDVVKCRMNMYTAATKKLELSMMPKKMNEDDDDDYVVEGRDPEGEEGKPQTSDIVEEEEYDPQGTLLWWRGAPYKKAELQQDAETIVAAEEDGVTQESSKIVEGTWRRMFELDLRADQSDMSSKALEMDAKEISDEIGELAGLDDSLSEDSFGLKAFNNKQFGASVPVEGLPDEWIKELSFFKEAESFQQESSTLLRGGKANEIAEFEKLLREVEIELDAVSPRRSKAATDPSSSVDDAVPDIAPQAVVDVEEPPAAEMSSEGATSETADVE